jgi:hypothetical protein
MTAQPKAPSSMLEVTPQRIQARAYEIYEARHGGPGDAVSDWLQAERELAALKRTSPLPEPSAAAVSKRATPPAGRT